MKHLTRRDILYMLGSASLLSSLPVAVAMDSNVTATPSSNLADLEAECRRIRARWSEIHDVTPETYLSQISHESMHKENFTVDCVNSDFNCGRCIEIDGLYLSYTEAALLAALGGPT